MKFQVAELLKSKCQTLWHDLFSVGHYDNGQLEVPDDLAMAFLAKCGESSERLVSSFTSKLLTAEDQSARLAACFGCEKNVAGICGLCSTCGSRPVMHKVKLDTETCPLGRWPKN